MQFPIVNTLEMFTLLQGLWENYTLKPSINILIVGLDNAGKTVMKAYLGALGILYDFCRHF